MSGDTCSNCGEPHDPEAVFCENCGFDFLTGSLPQPEPPVTSLGATGERPSPGADAGSLGEVGAAPEPAAGAPAAPAPVAMLTVSVDAGHHDRMDAGGALSLPDPLPDPIVVPVVSDTVLLGRSRPSKGLHPDVDLGADPAVSSRHAVLEREEGRWTITDLGSMNGTYLGDSTVALEAHTPVPISPETHIFVGGWTRLDLVDVVSPETDETVDT